VSFGPDNLPYGVAAPPGGEPRCVVRLHDDAIDLSAMTLPVPEGTFAAPALNPFLALGRPAWEATRAAIIAQLDYAPRFPLSRNQVDWEALYGGWKKAGYTIDVSLMFGRTPPDKWKDLPRDAFGYGLSFARFFGPSGTQPLAESIEIGNEPGHYSDAQYRALFENMARGLRQGDPKLRISTCAGCSCGGTRTSAFALRSDHTV